MLSAVRDTGHDGGTRVKGQSRFPRARRAAAPCGGCNRGPRAGGWAWAPASQITRSESWRPGRKRGVGRAGWSGGCEGASSPCLSPASGGCQHRWLSPAVPGSLLPHSSRPIHLHMTFLLSCSYHPVTFLKGHQALHRGPTRLQCDAAFARSPLRGNPNQVTFVEEEDGAGKGRTEGSQFTEL